MVKLTLSSLDKKFRRHFEISFYFFFQEMSNLICSYIYMKLIDLFMTVCLCSTVKVVKLAVFFSHLGIVHIGLLHSISYGFMYYLCGKLVWFSK